MIGCSRTPFLLMPCDNITWAKIETPELAAFIDIPSAIALITSVFLHIHPAGGGDFHTFAAQKLDL